MEFGGEFRSGRSTTYDDPRQQALSGLLIEALKGKEGSQLQANYGSTEGDSPRPICRVHQFVNMVPDRCGTLDILQETVIIISHA